MRSSLADDGAGVSAGWPASTVIVHVTTERAAVAIRPARDAATQRNALCLCVPMDVFRSVGGSIELTATSTGRRSLPYCPARIYLGVCIWALAQTSDEIEFDKVMPSCIASLSCGRIRNQLSQPDTDRTNLKLPGRINGRRTLGGCDATTGTARSRNHDITTNACPRSGDMRRRNRGGGKRRAG